MKYLCILLALLVISSCHRQHNHYELSEEKISNERKSHCACWKAKSIDINAYLINTDAILEPSDIFRDASILVENEIKHIEGFNYDSLYAYFNMSETDSGDVKLVCEILSGETIPEDSIPPTFYHNPRICGVLLYDGFENCSSDTFCIDAYGVIEFRDSLYYSAQMNRYISSILPENRYANLWFE